MVYYSKKSQQKMKARKAKHKSKHAHQQVNANENTTSTTVTSTSNKTRFEKTVKKQSNWEVIQATLKTPPIAVPSHLTSLAEKKKFRKTKRREARAAGLPEPVFVDNNEDNANNDTSSRGSKKKKQSYINISEVLVTQKQEQRKQAQTVELTEEEKSNYLALDCEMVGIGTNGRKSALARVSLVDYDGNVVLDRFVKVPDRVTDFRTWVSGVKAKHLKSEEALEPQECRMLVGNLIKDKVLVGHALKNDLEVLMLGHPRSQIRDTAKYKPYMRPHGKHGKFRPRKLKDLAMEFLGMTIQEEGEAHSSIDDAIAAMKLYQKARSQWEKEAKKIFKKK